MRGKGYDHGHHHGTRPRNGPVCGHARKTQKGLAFWFVRCVEGSVCPYCKAYERVYGRKAHEPARDDAA
jgi:hypothetical protein